VPDIITTAKGITSGYVPLGAVIVREKIARFFDDKMLFAGLTYNGHALACATALATIEAYEEDKIFENAKEVGKHLGACLEELKAKHPSVGDVRYIGLFSALELVKNRETKEPMDVGPLKSFLISHGLYVFNFRNILFVVPPLVITKEQLDEGLSLIDEGLAELMDKQTS
jgi:taurine--2-oxoglutarate transaminase